MSIYYPRAAVELRILPEDFKLMSTATKVVNRVFVQPKSVAVHINDYRATDTFTVTLDYRSFPFDPRLIRSCGIVIYIQDILSHTKADGTLNKLIPDAQKNGVLAGFVDEESIVFDDQQRLVTFEGRDYTALLIDQKYLDNRPIFPDAPVNKIIEELLATFKATQEIEVVNATYNADGTQSPLPILSHYQPDFGSPLAGGKNVGRHETYWDIIQDMVNRAGLICYMHLDKLYIATPKNQALTSPDDIKFIYGRNVKNLQLKRKLGRYKGFNISVRSRNEKEVLEAKIPLEATDEWLKSFGIQRIEVTIPVLKPDGTLDTEKTSQPAPYISFPVPNIASKEALIAKGETIFEQYSLQQLEGSFETKEMLSRGRTKNSKDDKSALTIFDLTKIKKGQTIAVTLDTPDLAAISPLASITDRTNYLIQHGYDRSLAALLAANIGKFSARFQIKSYVMSLDEGSGWDLKVNFQNILDLTQANVESTASNGSINKPRAV